MGSAAFLVTQTVNDAWKIADDADAADFRGWDWDGVD
jgi:hypothetical protein